MGVRYGGLALVVLAVCGLLVGAPVLHAAPRVDVLSTNLDALIEHAAAFPSRFAVDVPHAISPSTHGEWTTSGTLDTWRYVARIPTAVSMSFHAAHALLPDSARLTVTAGESVYVYTAKDIHQGEMWSRIARGDSLSFELTIATADASRLRFEIASLQAGYRGLGPGMPNHRRYNALAAKSSTLAAAAVSSCTENWACHTTPVNTGAGQATVAVVIANLGACSGTLLNDVRGDGTPYLLTARHCENGDPDGGSPEAAHTVSVYWDAVTPCGAPLGTIYDSASRVQFGATTVVEQQDAWLMRLDAPPVADDAYFAGWDATGAAFVGGFTPHHALGTSRQFIGWFGQASYNVLSAATLGVHFDSTLWLTVNAVGSGGGGASGSGLFDESGRLQGIVIRGQRQPDSDAGVCPASSPPAPSLQTATAFSTALSGIFTSTADPRSTTGASTLQSVLDPDHTGRMVIDGQTVPPVATLTGSAFSTYFTGQNITLTWTSRRTQSCTASGGESGDGWAGNIGTSGSRDLTSLDGGTVVYTITCTDGQRSASAHFQVAWTLSSPNILFGPVNGTRALYNVPFQLFWRANLRPCVASGGSVGDGWSGPESPSGTASVVENTLGDVVYQLTCGSGARATTVQTTMRVFPPTAQLVADAATLRVGEPLHLTTTTEGLPCFLSGGAAGDGWAGNTTYNGVVAVMESVPGTYTYRISCGDGTHVAAAQASVTFVAASTPPHVTLTATATSVPTFDLVTFNWDSNVGPCLFSRSGPVSGTLDASPKSPLATVNTTEEALGDYTYTVACGSGPTSTQASVTVSYTGTPVLNVFQGPTGAIAGQMFLMQYQSNLAPCTFTGGAAGDGWAGTSPNRNGNRPVVESAGGMYTYVATCGTGALALTRQASVTVLSSPPSVTVTADKTQQVWGQPVTVSWSSNSSPCQATGGIAGDGWSGFVDSSGSKSVTQSSQQGTVTYVVSCGTGNLTASGRVDVLFRPLAAPTLTSSATSVAVGQTFTLTWASSDGSACFSSDAYGDEWEGNRPANGTVSLRKAATGTYTFSLMCGQSLVASVVVTVTAPAPIQDPALPASAHLSANVSSVTAGNPVTLTWSAANVDSCTAGGGSNADGWSGALATSGGSRQVQESTPGTYAYTITCSGSGGKTSASGSVNVVVNAPQVIVSSSPSGGGGGGGALRALDISLLAFVVVLGMRRKTLSQT